MTSDWCDQDRIWRDIEINNKVYMISVTKKNESWEVLVTDLIEIWTETLTHEIMLRKCQDLNPLLKDGFEAFDWKQLVIDMLNDITEYIVEASVHRIKLQKNKGFIKLRFSLDLVKGTSQKFWQNVTMPFCLSSMELFRRHEMLLDLVKKKDEEIAEYKAEGAELIRKNIATAPFTQELFEVNAAAPVAVDFTKAFRSMFQFYNTINIPKFTKEEAKASLNSASNDDALNILCSSKNESAQKLTESHKDQPSTSKASILKLSSTSHTIQRPSKKNKTLSDFIL